MQNQQQQTHLRITMTTTTTTAHHINHIPLTYIRAVGLCEAVDSAGQQGDQARVVSLGEDQPAAAAHAACSCGRRGDVVDS